MRYIPATFCGVQQFPGQEPLNLWTIYTAIPGHCAYSTVSCKTLAAAGYQPYDIRPHKNKEAMLS